jgi:hypothetical protein
MLYNQEAWVERHRRRLDVCSMLTHLTKEGSVEGQKLTSVEVLVKILHDRCIIAPGKDGGRVPGKGLVLKIPRETYVIGPRPAVSFFATPLPALAQHLAYEYDLLDQVEEREQAAKVRYRGVGLAFDKQYAFRRGARPVIYEKTEVAKRFLPENEHWRIVNLDLERSEIIDWTHEQEWRAPHNFDFDLAAAILVVETAEQYAQLRDLAPEILAQTGPVTVLDLLLR